MTEPSDSHYPTAILDAELAAIIAHHAEIARLERECAKLLRRRLLYQQGDEGADQPPSDW